MFVNKRIRVILFLIGLFAWTRINLIGMIGISELVCLLLGPFLFLIDYKDLKRDGMLPLCWLLLLTCAGCLVSAFYNHSAFFQWIRGVATPLVVFSAFVSTHHFLKKDPNGIISLFMGWSLSGLFIFLFKSSDASALFDDGATIGTNTAAVMRMYLLSPIVLLPVRCYYSRIPWGVSFLILLLWGGYCIVASASGRSTALAIFAGALLVFVGQKSARKMARIRKHFILAICMGIVAIFIAKGLYSRAAIGGFLGEEARKKYELQTKGRNGILQLLMGGRAECFAGAFAALEQPIMGYGPWALDYNDTYGRFLSEYGDFDDAQKYAEAVARSRGVRLIPAHSHIVGFWLWYGIAGLILWIYVLYIIVEFFRKYIDVLPQWYGIFATMVPAFLWEIFFSPLCQRIQTAALLCAILLARSIGQRRCLLTSEMQSEREKFLP